MAAEVSEPTESIDNQLGTSQRGAASGSPAPRSPAFTSPALTPPTVASPATGSPTSVTLRRSTASAAATAVPAAADRRPAAITSGLLGLRVAFVVAVCAGAYHYSLS